MRANPKDRIKKNKAILEKLQEAPIEDEIMANRLRLYGYKIARI